MTHGNEVEGTEKAQIRKTEFLALGEVKMNTQSNATVISEGNTTHQITSLIHCS